MCEPLTRRQLIRAGALGIASKLFAPAIGLGRVAVADPIAPTGAGTVEIGTRAVELVRDSPVIDMLGLLTLDWEMLWEWQRDPSLFALADFRRLQRSGVQVFHPAVKTRGGNARVLALRWLARWDRLLASTPCYLDRINSTTDLDLQSRIGRLGVIVGFQDSDHFRDAADVETFWAAGQRVSQLTYNQRNRLGSGCYVQSDRGLTAFGAAVVGVMNRVGMTIDVSHCGERTTLDAIDASRVPVLATHANCRALVSAERRCKSDEVIRRLASRGGVIGVTTVRGFVGPGNPTIEDLLDHFDHVARVAGPEHVGLGSDTDVTVVDKHTGKVLPRYAIRGLVHSARVYQIADGLLRRGWLARDVAAVLGGNFRRALSEIWPPPERVASDWELRRDPFCPAPVRVPSDEVRVVESR